MLRIRRPRTAVLLGVLVVIGVATGCASLEEKERELTFRVVKGDAGWYSGIPDAVQELDLPVSAAANAQRIHAWWWPDADPRAPVVYYLHGVRWNLTGQLFRIEQLHALGYSVLAIDYRGFGQSQGDLPSETTVYEDARIAWERFQLLQPDPSKRLIYGHSLGGAVAIDLAAELGRQTPLPVRGLVIESTFTSLADVATAVANTSLPVRWLLSQKFDSIDKIADIHMPLLVVHGLDDLYVPPRFSEQLFAAAQEPKRLLLVPGASHNNSMSLAGRSYRKALDNLMQAKMPTQVVTHSTGHTNDS